MLKRLQVPINGEVIWEFGVNLIADYAVSQLDTHKLTASLKIEFPNIEIDLDALVRDKVMNDEATCLLVAKQMNWSDLDPAHPEYEENWKTAKLSVR